MRGHGMYERHGFYEFFAGGGLARIGLGDHWHCVFANDFCPAKATAYRAAFGPSPELRVGDVSAISPAAMP